MYFTVKSTISARFFIVHFVFLGDRRGHDRIVVEFITTREISANPYSRCKFEPVHRGEVYSIQHYAEKFVSDLRQVGDFLRVLRFPLPIKLTITISLKYC